MSVQKVGFIGLGTMGLPMAKNILKKHGALLAADLMEAPKQELKRLGADMAEDNAEAAGVCDVLFLSLPSVRAVEQVMLDPNGVIAKGKKGLVVLDTSTIGYKLSLKIGQAAAEKGIRYIDCPVSGGAGKASDGILSVMCGAAKDEMDAAALSPLVEMIGTNIHYAGTRGGGVALKIINNMLTKMFLFADGEAVLLAEHMGIPFETLLDVIQSSSSRNEILNIKKEHIAEHSYGKTGKSFSPMTMSLKDLGLARELADEVGIAGFCCNEMIQWYRIGVQQGFGDKDSSSIVELLRTLEPVRT